MVSHPETLNCSPPTHYMCSYSNELCNYVKPEAIAAWQSQLCVTQICVEMTDAAKPRGWAAPEITDQYVASLTLHR
jgi:hypothetical protein